MTETFGRHESYEERVTTGPDGKPVRHIKKISRDLTEEEARAALVASPFVAMKKVFKHMDEAFKHMDERMRKTP